MQNKLKLIVYSIGVLVLMGASFYAGSLSKELSMYRKGTVAGTKNTDVTNPTAVGDTEDVDVMPTLTYEDIEPISNQDHIRGNPNAKIALIEYSDYECPYCKTFHQSPMKLIEELPEDVMWGYRHFPLDSIHPVARSAAIASECVAELGGTDAFWRYTDTLFEQESIDTDYLLSLAQNMGFNINDCVNRTDIAERVNDDFNSGLDAGITGTPGNLLVNLETGQVEQIRGALPYPQLIQAVEAVSN